MPTAARLFDDLGWSALHAGASGQASLRLLSRLYQLNPESILKFDRKGRTPLHLACWHKGNDSVISFLLKQAPAALRMEDSQFETCLFRAARSQSLSMIQIILPGTSEASERDGHHVGDGRGRRPDLETQHVDDANNRSRLPPPPPLDDLGATCWNNSWLRSARRARPFARVFSL